MEPATILLVPLIALTSVRVVCTVCAWILATGRRLWALPFARVIASMVVAVLAFVASPRTSAVAATPPPGVRYIAEEVTDRKPPPTNLTPDESPRVKWTPDRTAAPLGDTAYEVRRGDSLWRIAKAWLDAAGRPKDGASVGRLWRAIYERNQHVIGENPDLILPGQQLIIPEA